MIFHCIHCVLKAKPKFFKLIQNLLKRYEARKDLKMHSKLKSKFISVSKHFHFNVFFFYKQNLICGSLVYYINHIWDFVWRTYSAKKNFLNEKLQSNGRTYFWSRINVSVLLVSSPVYCET